MGGKLMCFGLLSVCFSIQRILLAVRGCSTPRMCCASDKLFGIDCFDLCEEYPDLTKGILQHGLTRTVEHILGRGK